MPTQNNVDLVNIVDVEEFDLATTLEELSLVSRRSNLNKRILGESLPALIAANEDALGVFTGTTIPDDSTIKEALQALETEVESLSVATGMVFTHQSLLSGDLHVEASGAITATLTSGVLEITIPAGGSLKCGQFEFETGDALYTNSLVSGGIKLRIVNTANNAPLALQPYVMSKSSSGAISASNPLQYNTSINLAIVSDEYSSSGITSWAIQQIGTNAPAGGFLYF